MKLKNTTAAGEKKELSEQNFLWFRLRQFMVQIGNAVTKGG